MKFNINNIVKVKLTDKGREILKEQHKEFLKLLLPNVAKKYEKYIPIVEDLEGWSEWQLWCLMEAFGIHIGSHIQELPFETTIEIPDKKGE